MIILPAIFKRRPTAGWPEAGFRGDYSRQVGQHPATALAPPLGRKTPIPLKWTAKLPGSLVVGNFTALPRIPLANLDIPEPKARQHAGKRLACIFVGDLQDAVLQCGCLKLALSFLAYLAFKIRIGRGEQSGVA